MQVTKINTATPTSAVTSDRDKGLLAITSIPHNDQRAIKSASDTNSGHGGEILFGTNLQFNPLTDDRVREVVGQRNLAKLSDLNDDEGGVARLTTENKRDMEAAILG